MRHTARAVLAVALLCGFYALVVGVVAGFVLLAWGLARIGIGGATTFVVITGSLVTYVIVSAVVLGHRYRGVEPDGIGVTPEEQPELWQHVRSLADQVGTRPPDEIRLTAEANASVSERGRMLGLIGGTRRLAIGVPFLLGMSRDQLSGVLCHELGHYAGHHTVLGPVNYRGLQSVHRVVAGLGHTSRVGRVFHAYAGLYLRTASRVCRAQEVEADRTGARIVGRDTMISGLRELAPIAATWEDYVESYVVPAARMGMRTTDLATGFLDFAEHPARREAVTAVRDDFRDHGTHELDSHPSMATRVALLGQLPPTVHPEDHTPAYALLAEPDVTMARFAEEAHAPERRAELRATTWEEAGPTVERRYDEMLAHLLVRAVIDLPHRSRRPASLEDVVTEIRSGRLSELAAHVSTAATSWDTRVAGARLLTALLGVVLVRSGRAEYVLDWSGSGRLMGTDGIAYDVAALATRISEDPSCADEVLDLARDLEVPTHTAVVVDRPPELDPPPAAVAALAPLVSGLRPFALLVCTHGLALVRPRGWREVMAYVTTPVTSQNANRIVDSILEQPLGQALAERESESIVWARISSLRVRRRRLRPALMTLTLHTGEVRTMRLTRHAGVTGEPWGTVRAHLGNRVSIDDGI